MVRTPCEMVPSTPARVAYRVLKSFVDSCCRLACKASFCSLGRIVTVRRTRRSDCVQSLRLGQAWQSVVENLILMTSLVRLSIAGVQLLLVCPSGQVAC